MKKLLLLIAVAIASTTLAYSLSPIVVAVNYNNGDNLSVSVTEGSSTTPIYESEIEATEPNSSGLIIFSVGDGDTDWSNILESSVTTSHVVNVMDNGTIVAQYRLDYLIDLSARMGLISSSLRVKGDVTIEGDTYNNGNLSLNSEEFTTAAGLGAITSNIMVYTGSVDNEDPTEFEEANLNGSLEDNALYYIVNDGNQSIEFSFDNHIPINIAVDKFIVFIKVNGNIFILDIDQGFQLPPE